MEFSQNYKKRPVPGKRPRRGKAPLDPKKRNILIAVAALLVAAVFVTIGLVVHSRRAAAPAGGDEFQTAAPVTETQTAAPTTEAPTTEAPATEAPTQALGDVTVTDMQATMYSNVVTLNVRAAPSADSAKLGMVGQDQALSVTGRCSNGWYRIAYNGGVGYVSGEYVEEAPGGKQNDDAPYLLHVNRQQNIVTVYAKDANGDYTVPYKAMLCSVGTDGKTPTGTYNTTDQYTWRLLTGNVYGQYATRITGHILFHSVPYFTQDKSDLEYEEYNTLGQAASLGCIRLTVEDAKWIYDNCPKGTTVVIYDSAEAEPLTPPTPAKIDVNDSRRGWDPTDPDANNPW